MNVLEKDYYTIEESLKILQDAEINFNESDIYYYGECGKLKFNLYVGSRPAYAARYDDSEELFFMGHCKLHGIFQIQTGDLCAIIANDQHLIELLPGHPYATHLELSNWSTSLPKDVQLASVGYEKLWAPEEFSQELKFSIPFYYLRTKVIMQLKEIQPGALIPFNRLPDNLISDAIKFGIGSPKQWPENQIFNKKDLRITNKNLQDFITQLKEPKEIKKNEPLPIDQELPQQIEKDKRSTEKSQALTALAKSVWAKGEGIEYTAFERMLNEHSPAIPHEGFGDCTKIYLKGDEMHFTLRMDDGTSKKDCIKIISMKHHFKKAKKEKTS